MEPFRAAHRRQNLSRRCFDMARTAEPTLLSGIEALEARLLRVEYLLSQDANPKVEGASPQQASPKDLKVPARLANLENRFSTLVSRQSIYSDILRLGGSVVLSLAEVLM